MCLLLQQTLALVSNQYSNTSRPRWLDLNAPDLRLFFSPYWQGLGRATMQSDGLSTQTSDRTQVLQGVVRGLRGGRLGQDAAELEILDLTGKVLRIGWTR